MRRGWWAWLAGRGDSASRRLERTRRRPGVEPIEPRVVPSTAGAAPEALRLAATPPREARPLASALAERPGAAYQAPRRHPALAPGARRLVGRPAMDATAAPTEQPNVGKQFEFAVDTVQTGREMAYSPQVRKVGVSYAKLGLAHDTRKVGAAYFDAAIAGDGKKLNQLGHTRLVKKVGQDFENLSNTRLVHRVGDAFSSFGRAVADRFNKLF